MTARPRSHEARQQPKKRIPHRRRMVILVSVVNGYVLPTVLVFHLAPVDWAVWQKLVFFPAALFTLVGSFLFLALIGG